ncbi:TonB-dependent siderophore receptor [Arcobacter sp. FW59]|nr:TonB-dependent siderophore receptor [Arcobacter sp. FW59]
MLKNKRILFLSLVTSSLIFANETTKIEEITVSANKMEENIQDVPQSISVITQEELEEKRIVDIKGVISEIPNMNFEKALNGSLSTSFRGLNGSMFTLSNPVVIYVDGVPYYDRYDYNPSLINVEQVEVLRGPQGTLYGKDSTGGVINIITKTPSNEWKGSINTEYGNYDYIKGSFNTSGAIIDNKLFAGINGSITSDDGWITNDYKGMKKDDNRTKENRINAFTIYKPTDNLQIKLNVSHDYNKENGRSGINDVPSVSLNNLKRKDNKHVNYDVPSYITRKTDSQSLKFDYELENMKFESVTIHKDFSIDIIHDSDFKVGNAFDGLYSPIISDVETYSQEFKLSSKNQDIKWITGLFFDDEKREQGPYGNARPNGAANVISDINTNTYAAFSQVMIPFLEDFELTLGGRYQRIEKDINSNLYGSFTDTTNNSLHSYDDDKSWNTFIPKIALSYKLNDNLTTYASLSKGFIPGGFNFYSTSNASDSNFEPEKSTNYEIGAKYIGENFALNGAIFRMDIKDLHVYSALNNGMIWLTDNANKAHSEGIEFDGTYFITDNLSLSGSLGLMRAKYDDYKDSGTDYSGKKITNIPKFTSSLGITYSSEKGLYGNASIQGKGKTGFRRNGKIEEADGGFTANAKIGYKFKDLDIYSYITNITNEDYISSYGRGVGFNEPRRFGIGAIYKF